MKKITIEFTYRQALMLDLVVCVCGHRVNNHFEWDKRPCAHCKCKEYDEKIRVGKYIVAED
jgi:hypothetical protein